MRLRWTYLIYLLGAVSVVGCGESSGTVPVTGTVTLDGETVEGATVVLSPVVDTGQTAAGITDASGKFSLNCQTGTGAIPGTYKVAVSKLNPDAMGAAGADLDSSADDPDAAYGAAEEAGLDLAGGDVGGAEPTDLLPTKYNNPKSSGLTAVIKADGENELTLELKSK